MVRGPLFFQSLLSRQYNLILLHLHESGATNAALRCFLRTWGYTFQCFPKLQAIWVWVASASLPYLGFLTSISRANVGIPIFPNCGTVDSMVNLKPRVSGIFFISGSEFFRSPKLHGQSTKLRTAAAQLQVVTTGVTDAKRQTKR